MSTTPSDASRHTYFLFRPVAVVILSIFVIAAIAIAYVGGVMRGRSNAEKAYAQLTAEQTAKRGPAGRDETGESPVLAPEELEFARVLRNEQRFSLRGPMKPVQVRQEQKAQDRPGEKPGSPAQNAADAQTDQASSQSRMPVAAKGGTSLLYDYVFQVAAMKTEESADALRQRLEGRGLRTYLKREGKLLLIQVRFRGDSVNAQQVIRIVEQMHLGRPFLLSQKPVP